MAARLSRTASLIRATVALSALAATAGLVLAAPASAVVVSHTYYVGTSADNPTSPSQSTCESASNTVCTLRADIDLAAIDGAGYADTIRFSIAKGSTITLSPVLGGLELLGGETLTIDGQGASSTFISGGNQVSVFYTDMENLAIENVTVENGVAQGDGGGVENTYDLTLNQVNFTNDHTENSEYSSDGGAVYNDDSLTVNGGTYLHNSAQSCGGAIYNDYGVATASKVQFIDNASDCGGAVGTEGNVPESLTVIDSLFWGNVSRDYDDGGAAYVDGLATLTNNTFVDNVSSEYGGAIGVDNDGSATITNNTIVDNYALQGGGGVGVDNGTVTMSGNLLVGNTEVDGGPGSGPLSQCVGYGYKFTDGGGNVIGPDGDADCGFNRTTDRFNANPKLGPLQNNGGPTLTMAIADTSDAAIVVPAALCPITDQRGQLRGGTCSAGSYQAEPTGSATTCKALSGTASGTITFKSCTNKGSLNTSAVGSGAALTGAAKLTWHPSGKQSITSVTSTNVTANPCGGGDTTLKILGIVTTSTSPAAPYFDRVSAEVCEAPGTESVSLLHGTTAKL